MRCGDVLFPITLVAGRPHVLAAVEALRELPIGRWQKEHPVDPAPSWAPRAKFVLECKPLEKLRFGQAITADGVERLVEPLLQPGVGSIQRRRVDSLGAITDERSRAPA